MTTSELRELHIHTCQKCLSVMLSKNGAYNGYDDALGNFKSVENKGICTAETGLLVRLSDKMERLTNLLRGADANDEAIEDTIEDAINYLILLKAVATEEIVLDTPKEVY